MRNVSETPDLRYFRSYPACRMCGKKSDGLLFDKRNESYGDHCKKCADMRLADSRRVQQQEAAIAAPESSEKPHVSR